MKNKLIEGWKEVELGDILDYEQPNKYIIKGDILKDKSPTSIPVLTANKAFILGYTNEEEGVYDKPPVIIFDDFTTDNKFVNFKFKIRSSAMKILTPKTKEVDLKFIFLLIQTIKFNSTTHKRYYLSTYQKIKINLPPLQVQKHIVSILEKAEKLKHKRKEADKLTKEYLQSIFNEMFGDKSKLKSLKEVCEIIMGQSPPGNSYNETGDGTPFFQGKSEFTEKYPIVKKWTTQPTKIASPNSILMSVRAPVGSVNLCNIKCCIGRGLASIVPKKEVNLQYAYSWFKLNEQNISDLGMGSTFKAISSAQLANLQMPIPSIELQQKFTSIVEDVERLKEKQKQSKDEINIMFDSLMKQAFNGELVK